MQGAFFVILINFAVCAAICALEIVLGGGGGGGGKGKGKAGCNDTCDGGNDDRSNGRRH